jgi:hypothetical protein
LAAVGTKVRNALSALMINLSTSERRRCMLTSM